MFKKSFYNPIIKDNNLGIFYTTDEALDHCKEHHTYIRHYSFRGDLYIKYDGENIVWSDGSLVDEGKLPRNGNGWGKYYSVVYNYQSF